MFKKYQASIDKEIKKQLNIVKNKELRQFMLYALGFVDEKGREVRNRKYKGKRVRASLLIWVIENFKKDCKKALPIAAAIEIFHNFTLVHDDIEDNDIYRRNRKSLWAAIGIPKAVNAGDAMLVLSELIILDLEMPEKIKIEILKLFNKIYIDITQGQQMDMDFEGRNNIKKSEYLKMINLKTASLIAMCCEAGALISGASAHDREVLFGFGRNLGLSYQIRNDMEGVWGKDKTSGKKGKSDLKNKKITMPFLCLLEKLNQTEKKQCSVLLKKPKLNNSDIPSLLKLMKKYKIKKQCQSQKSNYLKKSFQFLDKSSLQNKNEIKNYFQKFND